MTENRIETEILAKYKKGLTVHEIAIFYAITCETVLKILKLRIGMEDNSNVMEKAAHRSHLHKGVKEIMEKTIR